MQLSAYHAPTRLPDTSPTASVSAIQATSTSTSTEHAPPVTILALPAQLSHQPAAYLV